MKMPGLTELVLILAIALIIFGPRKLPEIGRSIGRGIREFRSATTDVKKSINLDEVDDEQEDEEAKAPQKAGQQQAETAAGADDGTAQGSSLEETGSEAQENESAAAQKEEQKV